MFVDNPKMKIAYQYPYLKLVLIKSKGIPSYLYKINIERKSRWEGRIASKKSA